VVVTRSRDGDVAGWINRCAHRGAMVCRELRGNARAHRCVYHQWTYDERGRLRGVPFQQGLKGKVGMPADFAMHEHDLTPVRVAAYRGLVFGTLQAAAPALTDYIGPEMLPWVDRIFHKPVQYLGCTRQYAKSNWKLYYENVKDPYHASLLHLFHTTFNIYRSNMQGRSIVDSRHGLHAIITTTPQAGDDTAADYKDQDIATYRDQLKLADPSLLEVRQEFDEQTSNNIHTLFPSTVIQQIHNTLAVRQVLPKSAGEFELVFHFFGYADDDDALRALRLKQANPGRAGRLHLDGRHRGDRARATRDRVLRRGREFLYRDGRRSARSRQQPHHRAHDPQLLERLSRCHGLGSPLNEAELYFRIERLFANYCACLDEGELEAWPEFFVADGLYKMIARENYAHGYPIPLLLLDSKGMMQDRVYSLLNANIYQAHRYRHAQAGVRITGHDADGVRVSSSYIVVQTLNDGTTAIYQAGSYYDRVVETVDGWRFKERLVVYDTARVQTLLATPV
jgi:phenylpropionate dioxygenase-like ring-hydroxylating dioxygenase large terminal subunit/3-phenylpropionate/cinnamic acid dioxygenase small subunit